MRGRSILREAGLLDLLKLAPSLSKILDWSRVVDQVEVDILHAELRIGLVIGRGQRAGRSQKRIPL